MTFDADDFESSGFDSVPPWRMEAHELDDLECSLRYLEREDRRAWDHVQVLLSELREEVRETAARVAIAATQVEDRG